MVTPYVLHTKILYGGISGKYLEIKGLAKGARKGDVLSFDSVEKGNMQLWKNFHFGNFILPFPLHHPQVLVLPVINEYFPSEYLIFGVKYANTNVDEYASFLIQKPKKLDWSDFQGKFFNLPIAKKIINEKTIAQIWEDMFVRDLNILLKGNKFSKILSIPYSELVYNLFIQALRLKYFPANVLKVSFIKDRSIGVVELAGGDERYRNEIIFTLNDDVVYMLSFQSRKWAVFSETIRNRFFSDFNFKMDEEMAADLIYSEYKLLSYSEKIDQQGMTYLFSAWSHVTWNKEFLREMIQFLERGKNNIHHLNSLYQYGYKRFGTTFSLKEERLQEKVGKKLERKMKEELEEEIREEEQRKEQETEGQFENNQERIRFLLRKAKDSGKDSDENDDMIIE